MNVSGSMMGDALQNAITGDRGIPDASIAAIRGIAPHEQKVQSAPAKEPATIATVVFPENARATN
ncbi:MAG: hypothetical protein PVI06_15295 [Desulfobacterales bacterium]|jgi:hypothetical protein